MTFDPRTMGKPVYLALNQLRETHAHNEKRLKEQKSQAVELYTYLATWGMMRLIESQINGLAHRSRIKCHALPPSEIGSSVHN